MTNLNRDCLWEIFTNLEHDKKSLHGALLVNRLWCEVAVQFLWRKPFRFLYTCSKFCNCSEQRRRVKVKKFLATLTTILAHKHTTSSVNIQDLVIWTAAPLTTFTYTDFIRHLDIHDLVWALYDGVEYLRSQRFLTDFQYNSKPFFSDITWSTSTITLVDIDFTKNKDKVENAFTFESSSSPKQPVLPSPTAVYKSKYKRNSLSRNSEETRQRRTDSLFQKMTCDLCRLLVLYCPNLSHLSIDMVNTKWSEDNQRCTSLPSISFWITVKEIPNEILLIPTYAGSQNCLSRLVEFTWGATHWTSEFLDALSKITHHLRKLVIDMSNFGRDESKNDARRLSTLIKVQRCLQEIKFIKCKFRILSSIMEGLRTQAKTLRIFYFQGIVKDWSIFSEVKHLTNLKELIFSHTNFQCNEVNMIEQSYFPHLIKLSFNVCCFRDQIILPELVVQRSGKTLRTFTLTRYYYPDGKYNFRPQVITTVAKYCQNLVHLEIFVDRREFQQLMLLFASCPLLEKVKLTGNPDIADELFTRMATQELSNLKELIIDAQWRFCAKSLETFIIKTKAPLKSLVFRYSPDFSDAHLDVLFRYLKEHLHRLHIGTDKRFSRGFLEKAKETIVDFRYKINGQVHDPVWL
ncbi:hypothetical protein C1645_779522 [Glomus cerebriforme]|uniref:F-box domain-containing protein n=1 Tax=Glomus cerebriforme TaxID=658196 RepID=A0A397SKA1_9GLOM|nr:hypothetical protein C1645_779522 [Glomus cerebriforme]